MKQYKFEFGERRLCGKYHKVKKLWEGISPVEEKFQGDSFYAKKYNDSNAMNDLEITIESDGELHRQQFMPIINNIKKKIKGGSYNHSLVAKLWLYLVDAGAKKYAKEFASHPSEWSKIFIKKDRIILSEKLADYYYDQIKAGEYGEI
jgi:hypothetical protein